MKTTIDELLAFVAVVDTGSITAAADPRQAARAIAETIAAI